MGVSPEQSVGATVQVRRLGEGGASEAAWTAYAAAAPGATFYHDLAWREVFRAAFGYRFHGLVALDRGGTVCGILPLYAVRGLTGGLRLVAVPFRDRGGILASDDAAFLALVEAADGLRRELGAATATIKSIERYDAALAARAGLRETLHWVRSVVDLGRVRAKGLDKATAFKRGVVRQAVEAGLSVEEASGQPRALDDWYLLHQSAQRALGLPPFPQRLFATLLSTPFALGAVKLFLVRGKDGQPIAGTIVFLEQRRAIYAYSASLPEARSLRPNDLMLHHVYGALVGLGVDEFDMGSDSPDQTGLLLFKKQWLAVQAPIPTYQLGAGVAAFVDSSDRRYALARMITRRLPLVLARRLMAPLVRFLG